ncbi:MAG: general secretion pathway protein GspB [Proteobacteria bacterium]|nr:general secretion pathway protein GspB [Pseudomonadota bacterium]
MSFILDALRKSDQQRSRSATPTLNTAQTVAAESRQPALWWYGLIAAVLVGAGILIGWMHQAPPEPVAMTVAPGASKPVDNKMPTFTPAALPAVAETVRKSESQQPQAATPVPAAPPAPVAEAKPVTAVTPPSPGPVASTSAANAAAKPVEPNHPVQSDAQREPVVPALAELPPAIQQEIPKLAILAHSYSSRPKARFVFINDRMVHEEEYPLPGLKLEQITPDGMIFSYKGYRFRRAANSDAN